jgi:hypothetical protein
MLILPTGQRAGAFAPFFRFGGQFFGETLFQMADAIRGQWHGQGFYCHAGIMPANLMEGKFTKSPVFSSSFK